MDKKQQNNAEGSNSSPLCQEVVNTAKKWTLVQMEVTELKVVYGHIAVADFLREIYHGFGFVSRRINFENFPLPLEVETKQMRVAWFCLREVLHSVDDESRSRPNSDEVVSLMTAQGWRPANLVELVTSVASQRLIGADSLVALGSKTRLAGGPLVPCHVKHMCNGWSGLELKKFNARYSSTGHGYADSDGWSPCVSFLAVQDI
jgi:hypothetical protein